MGGLIGVIANDSARYSLFTACVLKLDKPEGAKVEMLIGGDWCRARNDLAKMTIENGHDWLWFMDDDHAFSPSLLNRLLTHEKPLVVPVCLTRVAPFVPVTYTERIPDAEFQYLPLPLTSLPTDGLVEIQAGGCAGMLIRREVLEAIEPPWFEYGDRSEDIVFCEKAKAAGFEIYTDLAARLGHITTAVVWPYADEESWQIGITVGRDMNLFVPFETAEEPEA